jgi:hypothetical protein
MLGEEHPDVANSYYNIGISILIIVYNNDFDTSIITYKNFCYIIKIFYKYYRNQNLI